MNGQPANASGEPVAHSVNRKALAAIFLILLTLLVLPHILDAYVVPTTWDGWWFVAQTLAGNWSPPSPRPGPLSNYWFLFVAEIAIIVNLGPYLFLWNIITRVSKIERKYAMELNQVLDERDTAIITLLLSTVPRERRGVLGPKFRQAFADGHTYWLNELVPAGHDPETAAKIVDALKSAKFGPG